MKIGDEIYCIDSKESKNLETLSFYYVTDVNEYGNIQVKEKETGKTLEHYYKPARFEPAQTTEKVPLKKTPVSKTIDLSKKYKTRNGCEVNLIAFSKDKDYPVLGETKSASGKWKNDVWRMDGFFCPNGPSDYDLVEVPDEITISGFQFDITVYPDQSAFVTVAGYSSALKKEKMAEIIAAWQSFS